MEVHQHVVDQILHLAVVLVAKDLSERHTVGTTKWMVGRECEVFAVLVRREFVQTSYLHLHVEILNTCVEKVYTHLTCGIATDEGIHIFLMQDFLQPVVDELRDILRLIASFLADDFIHINQKKFFFFCHNVLKLRKISLSF